MDRLPAEIIELIGFDLRGKHVPLEHKFDMSEVYKCPCHGSNTQRLAACEDSLSDRSLLKSKDGALSFSMTCKRIREIVFDRRRNRTIRSAACDEALKETLRMPAMVRENVR